MLLKVTVTLFCLPLALGTAAANEKQVGTDVARRDAVVERVLDVPQAEWDDDWKGVRKRLLFACGLRDLPYSQPGKGYTGHCFQDWNHVDCCTMRGSMAFNENRAQVPGIAYSNQLGVGIETASLPLEGSMGGSWCTCQMGAGRDPPVDVCHKQFLAQVGFKLLWCPGEPVYKSGVKSHLFESFVLVGDDGDVLARGRPTGTDLPTYRERKRNWEEVEGGMFAEACQPAKCNDDGSFCPS